MPKPNEYTISDLAAEFDITTRTIRFYEEKGLLQPRREGNARIYTPADRTKLKLILRGNRLGFSLDESRSIIEMYDPEHDNSEQLKSLLAKIREKQEQLKVQLNDIEAMMLDLRGAEEKCLEALATEGKESAERKAG